MNCLTRPLFACVFAILIASRTTRVLPSSWRVPTSRRSRCTKPGCHLPQHGVAGDAIEILRDQGTNWFRLRLFVDPQFENNYNGGYDPFVAQDLEYTIALAQRIKQAGGKILLDFHYSDTWADPGSSMEARRLEIARP